MIGETIGRYRIIEKIGTGGMGEVYKAEDIYLRRPVALKFLGWEVAQDRQALERFQREARVASVLNDPHIAAIYNVEETGGVAYLVLEFVEGQTLAERLALGPIPLEEALEISRQIAKGLAVAHDQGMIHRDLKPSNVIVTPEGIVKVLDFGLASPKSEARAGVTRAGLLFGTPAYMSPEQAMGQPLDERADVWAFGCLLFEMLTGKRAFQGEAASDVLVSVLKTEPDWKALPAETPVTIRWLLRRCLAKDPKKRYESGMELLRELEALRQDEWRAWPRVAPCAAPIADAVEVFPTFGVRLGKKFWKVAFAVPALAIFMGASIWALDQLSTLLAQPTRELPARLIENPFIHLMLVVAGIGLAATIALALREGWRDE